MSAVVICASKQLAVEASVPSGAAVTLSLHDIRRSSCASEAVAGSDVPVDVVNVVLLVELALRRLRAVHKQPALSRADRSALARKYSLLRTAEGVDAGGSGGEATSTTLVASTPLQGYTLAWWVTLPTHTFLLVPLEEVVGSQASEAIRNAFSTPGRHRDSTALGNSTSLRRAQANPDVAAAASALSHSQQRPLSTAKQQQQHLHPQQQHQHAILHDDPYFTAGVVSSLSGRLLEAGTALHGGALLAAPLMSIPSLPLSQWIELINAGVARGMALIPEAADYVLCTGCRTLHIRMLQMQCCGACQCARCAVSAVTCIACGEDAADVEAPKDYPQRAAVVAALAWELVPMHWTELMQGPAGTDGGGRRGILSGGAVLATPPGFR